MKHSSPPPPPTMSTYRPRLVEVHALDCGDGRHVLLTDPPRYMPSPQFLESYELVAGHQNGNGRRPKEAKRVKGAKRSKVARRAKASAAGEPDPKKEQAQKMFEKDGKRVSEISSLLKLPYSRIYAWSQGWKAPTKAKPAESGDDGWMK